MRTHYELLGVAAAASTEEIKRAYHRAARRLHPDTHTEASADVRAQAERAMADLNVAWQVLRDPGRRAAYDVRVAEEVRRRIAAEGAEHARQRDLARRRRAARTRSPAVEDPAARPPPQLGLGAGFRPWLGASGVVPRGGPAAAAGGLAPRGVAYSLAVDGALDLSPLRRLVPDGLVALHAVGARFGDEQLAHLAGHRSLRVLDLSSSRIGDAGLLHLAALEGLETLMLWDTAVTDRGAELLARCSSLRVLGLGNTAVTDRGVRALARLGRLQVLQLWGTAVQGPGLRALDACPGLELVSLPWRVRGRWRRHLRRTHPGLTLT